VQFRGRIYARGIPLPASKVTYYFCSSLANFKSGLWPDRYALAVHVQWLSIESGRNFQLLFRYSLSSVNPRT
jgi:hypothetical protein